MIRSNQRGWLATAPKVSKADIRTHFPFLHASQPKVSDASLSLTSQPRRDSTASPRLGRLSRMSLPLVHRCALGRGVIYTLMASFSVKLWELIRVGLRGSMEQLVRRGRKGGTWFQWGEDARSRGVHGVYVLQMNTTVQCACGQPDGLCSSIPTENDNMHGSPKYTSRCKALTQVGRTRPTWPDRVRWSGRTATVDGIADGIGGKGCAERGLVGGLRCGGAVRSCGGRNANYLGSARGVFVYSPGATGVERAADRRRGDGYFVGEIVDGGTEVPRFDVSSQTRDGSEELLG